MKITLSREEKIKRIEEETKKLLALKASIALSMSEHVAVKEELS